MGKKIAKCLGIVLSVTIVTIIIHIFLPADTTSNSVAFNSSLVKAIGFPAVASIYFFIFFLHLYFVFNYLLKRTQLSIKSGAIRLGIGFSILPLLGMFEISPDTIWNLKVAFHQLFIGGGDAVPVLLLAFLIYEFCYRHTTSEKIKSGRNTYQTLRLQTKSKIMITAVVAIVFFMERLLCYYTGITLSAVHDYTVPCLIWTVTFGIGLGIACTTLYPVYASIGSGKKQSAATMVLTLGLNWIWFNNFIALICKEMVVQMTVRSGIDVIVVVLAITLLKGKIRYEEV